MRNASIAVRQSTTSALPNTVRVHMPTGNAVGCRSSAQNALIVQAARGPDTVSAVSRCETSTVPASGGTVPSDTSNRNSSGPSHSRALAPNVVARQVSGNVGPIDASVAALPRMISRVTGGNAASCTAGQSGDSAANAASGCARSAMQAPALLVVSDGIRHANGDGVVGHRHVQRLANPCAAPGHHGQRDRTPQRLAPI